MSEQVEVVVGQVHVQGNVIDEWQKITGKPKKKFEKTEKHKKKKIDISTHSKANNTISVKKNNA